MNIVTSVLLWHIDSMPLETTSHGIAKENVHFEILARTNCRR